MGFFRSKSNNGNAISEIEVDGEVFSVDDSNTEEVVLMSADLGISLSVSTEDILDDDKPTKPLTPSADETGDPKSE